MLASYLYKILLSQIQRGIFPFSIPLFYHNLFALASFPNFLKSFPFCPFARHSSTNCLPTVLSRMCWVFNSPTLCLRTAVINLDKNRSSSSRNFFRVRKFLNREKKKRYYKINEQLDLLDLNCSQRWHWINNSFDYLRISLFTNYTSFYTSKKLLFKPSCRVHWRYGVETRSLLVRRKSFRGKCNRCGIIRNNKDNTKKLERKMIQGAWKIWTIFSGSRSSKNSIAFAIGEGL